MTVRPFVCDEASASQCAPWCRANVCERHGYVWIPMRRTANYACTSIRSGQRWPSIHGVSATYTDPRSFQSNDARRGRC